MDTTKKDVDQGRSQIETDFVSRFWEESWTYIKTVVDVVREPVLILNKDLRVLAANESFYRTFQVDPKDTEKKIVYELGNGQWDIPALRKLLDDILPKHTFFNGFEVTHEFQTIGRKVMMLNARRIYTEHAATGILPPIILLAMEDVTEMMAIAETLAIHANQLEAKLVERTQKLETHIGKLQKEIEELKVKS
jgi:chemotaxis protein methyltransferase CheR